ncbi:MFS transporter [Gryllotalpicola reticulitermitis]|uniref:MFS transporter n=1 Tax=Gryllotalpicola reticulitermitis TaxID=1184153 RepID=A0ABV8Q6L0_9MICO
MSATSTTTESVPALAPASGASTAPGLTLLPSRWIDGWDPENATQWENGGSAIAARNLRWSIFAEFLGFVVWQLWSIVVVSLPTAGFHYSVGQTFWLISMPSLVGATLRFPYTFMVPKFGGRNWTIVSASLLIIPATALAIALAHPSTPFGVMLLVAALAGFGGGNFASSMANITYFYPQRTKGWALGLNAAGGNIGAAVAQLLVPILVTLTAGATLNLPIAGWFWLPLIAIAIVGAATRMNNLTGAKADLAASVAAIREPHLWLLALLYIGTFGSFIGFSGVFPKLIADEFPQFSAIHVGTIAFSLAFLGAAVGSLSRPYGGRLADRFGGAPMTAIAFVVMAAGTTAAVLTLPAHNFAIFLVCFLVLFVASGVGNGAMYRMIPTVFALRGGSADAHRHGGDVSTQRKASAALGIVAAFGAYGGFLVPQLLGASKSHFGDYAHGLWWFVAAYAGFLGVTLIAYVVPAARKRSRL